MRKFLFLAGLVTVIGFLHYNYPYFVYNSITLNYKNYVVVSNVYSLLFFVIALMTLRVIVKRLIAIIKGIGNWFHRRTEEKNQAIFISQSLIYAQSLSIKRDQCPPIHSTFHKPSLHYLWLNIVSFFNHLHHKNWQACEAIIQHYVESNYAPIKTYLECNLHIQQGNTQQALTILNALDESQVHLLTEPAQIILAQLQLSLTAELSPDTLLKQLQRYKSLFDSQTYEVYVNTISLHLNIAAKFKPEKNLNALPLMYLHYQQLKNKEAYNDIIELFELGWVSQPNFLLFDDYIVALNQQKKNHNPTQRLIELNPKSPESLILSIDKAFQEKNFSQGLKLLYKLEKTGIAQNVPVLAFYAIEQYKSNPRFSIQKELLNEWKCHSCDNVTSQWSPYCKTCFAFMSFDYLLHYPTTSQTHFWDYLDNYLQEDKTPKAQPKSSILNPSQGKKIIKKSIESSKTNPMDDFNYQPDDPGLKNK